MIRKSSVGLLIVLVAGCGVEFSHDRPYVARGIEDRTGHGLGPAGKPGEFSLPPGVHVEDSLSEDEGVAVALWNNAQFQADLATLGLARADLIEANMLTNPAFSLFFPVGPKLLETKLNVPVEALWQRPRRVAAAKIDAQSISENLIQHGLGLVRDVRTAFADLRAAELRIEAAGRRIGWEKSRVYNFIAIIDGKDKGEDPLTIGPGFQVDVPIVNQNNGRIARAKAEIEQAARQYEAVRQSIVLQVREAYTQYIAAHREDDLWRSSVVPSLENAADLAQRSFDAGDTS